MSNLVQFIGKQTKFGLVVRTVTTGIDTTVIFIGLLTFITLMRVLLESISTSVSFPIDLNIFCAR